MMCVRLCESQISCDTGSSKREIQQIPEINSAAVGIYMRYSDNVTKDPVLSLLLCNRQDSTKYIYRPSIPKKILGLRDNDYIYHFAFISPRTPPKPQPLRTPIKALHTSPKHAPRASTSCLLRGKLTHFPGRNNTKQHQI